MIKINIDIDDYLYSGIKLEKTKNDSVNLELVFDDNEGYSFDKILKIRLRERHLKNLKEKIEEILKEE